MTKKNTHHIELFKNISAFTFGLLVAIIIGTIIIRLTDYDAKILWPSLYFTEGVYHYKDEKEVYRSSASTERLYELKPNANIVCMDEIHPLETKDYKEITISINSVGFRDVERNIDKKDTFRIIVLGGSNTFGLTVANEDTYPAVMQKLFDEKIPGKVEVWNAGLSGYVMLQKIAYAEEIVEKYNPDLLIFQDDNRGRRAFFYGEKNVTHYFRSNKSLFLENIPLLVSENNLLTKMHYNLVKMSRLYRFVMGGINNIIVRINVTVPVVDDKADPTIQWWSSFNRDIKEKYLLGSEKVIDHQKFEHFIQSHNSLPVIRFRAGAMSLFQKTYFEKKNNFYELWLGGKGKPREYMDIHPPSYVYEWMARELTTFILEGSDLVGTEYGIYT